MRLWLFIHVIYYIMQGLDILTILGHEIAIFCPNMDKSIL